MKYESDIEKMEVALEQAKLAYENDEIPVGAALFNENDELVVSDHNRRELDQDPTSHAEILVLKAASKTYKSWRLEGSTLVVTLEPDPMCAGAIVNARVKRLIFLMRVLSFFLKNIFQHLQIHLQLLHLYH